MVAGGGNSIRNKKKKRRGQASTLGGVEKTEKARPYQAPTRSGRNERACGLRRPKENRKGTWEKNDKRETAASQTKVPRASRLGGKEMAL